MARYRAAIVVGGDIAEITRWINEAKFERLEAGTALRSTGSQHRMTRDEINSIVERFASLATVINGADQPTRPRSTAAPTSC